MMATNDNLRLFRGAVARLRSSGEWTPEALRDLRVEFGIDSKPRLPISQIALQRGR